jgi:exosortase
MKPAAVPRPRPRRPAGWLPALLLVAAGLALLYGPVVRDLVGAWTAIPYNSHGFVVVAWSAWLIWSARPRSGPAAFAGEGAGLAVAGAGLAVLGLAHALDSLTLAALSLPIVLGGLGRLALGRDAFRPLIFPVASLALMAPLPTGAVPALSWQLQGIATSFTTLVLGALAVPFSRDGMFIRLDSAIVHVSEACNGLRFLMAMLVLGVAFAWAAGRALADRMLMVALALAAGIAGNLVRVSTTTVLVHLYGPSASEGLFHNLFGKGVYLVVVSLFFLSVLFMSRYGSFPPFRRSLA